MHYPLIVVLPAGTTSDELDDDLGSVMAPFYEYQEPDDGDGVDEDGEFLIHPNGKWERYEIGERYAGFFPVRHGADPHDVIAIQTTAHGSYCDGGRIRALDLDGKRDAAARYVGTRPADLNTAAAQHWNDISGWVRAKALTGGAVLTHEGEWISPEGVRFVCKAVEGSPQHAEFVARANSYLDSLANDMFLIIVDCRT